MNPGSQSTASGAQDELSLLMQDLAELASSATGIDREKLTELKQSLHERVEKLGDDARDAAKNAASSIHQQAEETLGKVDSFAHAKPWQLALAAGLIGFAVGALVTRK